MKLPYMKYKFPPCVWVLVSICLFWSQGFFYKQKDFSKGSGCEWDSFLCWQLSNYLWGFFFTLIEIANKNNQINSNLSTPVYKYSTFRLKCYITSKGGNVILGYEKYICASVLVVCVQCTHDEKSLCCCCCIYLWMQMCAGKCALCVWLWGTLFRSIWKQSSGLSFTFFISSVAYIPLPVHLCVPV